MYPSLRRVGCPWVWTLQRNTQDSSALQREDGSVAQHPRFCHRFCMCVPVLSLLQARCMCCVCPGHFLLPLRLTAGLDGCIVAVIVSVHHHCPLVAGAAHGIPAVYLGCVLQGRVCTLLCVCVCVWFSPSSQQNRAYRFCVECSFTRQVHSFVSGLLWARCLTSGHLCFSGFRLGFVSLEQ